MAEAFLYIILVIAAAGTLGGTAAFISQSKSSTQVGMPVPISDWHVFVTLGIVSAGCVPLFLSLTKSALIGQILQAPAEAPAYENYLILIGLCLVAAFSARRFIGSITDQILRKADQAQKDAARAEAAAADAREVAHEALNETEAADDLSPPPAETLESAGDDEPETDARSIHLTPEDRKALLAMMNRTYRTASGIAEDAGIARHRVSEVLESLADKKLALPTTSPRTGGARWIITKRGTQAISGSI